MIIKNLQLPEEIWLAGKGPSIDTFDWDKAGSHRFAVNEACFLVPYCMGVFVLDYNVQKRFLEELDPRIIVFRKHTHKNYVYPKMYIWRKDVEVSHIFATAPTAVDILHYLGARKIHFVGFDSIGDDPVGNKANNRVTHYSDKVKEIKGEGTNRDGFLEINRRLKNVVNERGIKAIWHHIQ